ncbi:hypothetical protein [Neptuniibacter pectenicola]|uniref:hypothetical protein n=1 Tax=Neptuniibacter pectenicola TaxID=1806669 RepID=UPI00083496B7|nr:hypothetical protein [Neptuniibacter pectenicola]
MPDSGVNYIAWWGAILSTLLACIKVWEIWSNRFRLDIGHNFTSDPIQGNDILIRNLSSKPIILEYWELHYCSRWWLLRKFEEFESPGPDACDSRIEAHSSKTLSFREQYHFSWSDKALKGRSIYIKIYIAGRKPFYRKVFG